MSVHRKSKLIIIQRDWTTHSLIIAANCSTCFGQQRYPSSGAHKTALTASGTSRCVWAAPATTTSIRCECSYMCSWWWAQISSPYNMAWRPRWGGSGGIVVFFFNLSIRWGWVFNTTPRSLYPRERNSVPKAQRLGGPQDRSGRVRKASPPPAFDPRTVHPVARRYTDWATPAHRRLR
jgi:hypothetical protein